jgi:hypothetical protein
MTNECGRIDESLLAEDIDALIDQAVVRLVDSASNKLVGSGFLIAPDLVVTCRHVLASNTPLDALCGSARARVCRLVDAVSGLDLAIIQLDAVLGQPIAASGVWNNPPLLAGRAAVAPKTGIIGSAPFELKLNGAVSVQYLPDGTVLDSAIDLAGAGVVPGASGSPLVDRNARAAVAVVVGGNPSLRQERIWAVPLAHAVTTWPALASALERNDRDMARYAMLMNARGAAVLFRVLSQRKQKNLSGEERFVANLDVFRAALAGALSGFLASNKHLIAVVGASNVGKSWALASFAFDVAPNEVRVLIEARNLALPGPLLPDLIHEELARALGAHFMHLAPDALLVPPERFGKVLRQTGVNATVIIDGLNEASRQDVLVAWLRHAVAWCEEHGIRLVLSCREESWPQLVASLDLDEGRFYRPRENSPAAKSSAPWCFNLSDFSDAEAAQAATQYKVDAAVTGAHPLMFRLAQRLQGVDARSAGRYRVLLRYIEHRLAKIADRFGLGPSGTWKLRSSLVAFADLLAPGGVGAVSLDKALQLIGPDALFDALVTEGLLSCSAEYVRFRHDQLADVLRTIRPDMVVAFAADRGSDDELAVSLASTALLRYECEGPNDRFEAAMALLLSALGDHSSASLRSSAVRVVRALPYDRLSHIEAICRRLAESESDYSGEVAACISDAPLDVALRVELLLTLATHASGRDESGWPVRLKDWRDPGRRHDFRWTIDSDLTGASPQRHLFGLLQQHREAVFPLLVQALRDSRAIKREATIGSLCAGLLFVDADQHLMPVLSALLRSASSECGRELLLALTSEYPAACADVILADLEQGPNRDVPLEALMNVERHWSDARISGAIHKAFDLVRGDPGRLYTAVQLALLIRKSDPQEVDAWDFLCEHPMTYMGAGVIPDARFERALEWIGERGCDFAEFVCVNHVGTIRHQEKLIGAIRAGLLACGRGTRLGWLLESKLDQLEDEPALQRPWQAFAAELIATNQADMRSFLATRAFAFGCESPWTIQMRDLILACVPGADVASFVREGALLEPTGHWLRQVHTLRPHAPGAIDACFWRQLAKWHDLDIVLDKARALLDYWRGAPVSTELATTLLARLDAGESVDALLNEESDRLSE